MAKPTYRVGDSVTLPSGLVVPIVCAAVPERPWTALQVTFLWHVCREHGRAGHAGVSHYFGGKKHPLQLDEEDARALATILNQVDGAA